MFKDKRIVREFLMIFAIILFTVLVSAGILFLNRREERRLLERMLEHNVCAGSIYDELKGMEESLRNIRTDGAESGGLDLYREYAGRLHEDLQVIETYAAADQVISENIGKIQEFYNYQEGMLNQEYSVTSIQRLKDSMPELIACAKAVAEQTFADSIRVYTEAVRLTDRTQLTVWGCNAAIFISGMFLIMGRLNRVAETLGENRRIAEALTAHKWDVEDAKLGPYSDLNELSTAINRMKHEMAGYARRLEPKQRG